eukprot:Blabericola_migrator_1__7512@NODE_3839_length_1476_cov_197_215756_g2380_i0_p2_GENE_NODE_3839_length_1476_cov_197_215756_g2380_i0NODE_3839_length_1476_cov_197_215756_g2380_i0_p2_ORF_typecomplete_len160_score21_67Ribosomal_L21e/PF01157_18/7_2e34_NODE_3839_length_1476_cov_197_215756_g2380_i0122601
MTHSYGFRSGTRYKYQQPFRQHGKPHLSKYLTVYKRGDYVTVKTNPAIQKGMPYSFYHGRTGVVYDVTPTSLGVLIPKRVRTKEHLKKIHIRVEHVFKARCREEFENRRAETLRLCLEAKKAGKERPVLKRLPLGPRGAETVIPPEIKDIHPLPFEEIF